LKIRLGPSGIPISCKYNNSIEGVKRVAQIGLNAMEVSYTHGVRMSLATSKELGEVAKKLDVELSVHVPYYINLASIDEEKIKASKKRILKSLERGHLMNATVAAVHVGYYGKDKDLANKKIYQGCKEICDEIEHNGWKTLLGIETMGKQKAWGTLDEIIAICKKLKNVIPYIDFAHVYARNGGYIDYKEIFDKLEILKLKKIHSHFSGIKYSLSGAGKGNEIRHVPIKEAGPDFKELAKKILKRKLNITIISESPILEMDSLLMKSIFERLGYKF